MRTFTQLSIRFTPIRDIKKSTNGQINVYFFANKTYLGVQYFDGTIAAYSPICNKTIIVNEKHIKIEEIYR